MSASEEAIFMNDEYTLYEDAAVYKFRGYSILDAREAPTGPFVAWIFHAPDSIRCMDCSSYVLKDCLVYRYEGYELEHVLCQKCIRPSSRLAQAFETVPCSEDAPCRVWHMTAGVV